MVLEAVAPVASEDFMRRAPIEFRTTAILYTLLGIIIALVIHFVVLSSPRYNWLQLVGG